ncbi:MAG: sigma-54 dependent transcriptional regulator [Muribaculaceae bacterium]|nr:sigma-54 dependent transcriptional regulator [Muribaculaceae bacterium]MDE6793098.1 sigma-54 dependent transcriptional regulator [Muribaculaceae bacterium]
MIMPDITQVKNRFSIVGNSAPLEAAIERAVRVAPIDLSVLVYGESGSGKEFFPKIIHAYGNRKHKKYIAVNCGAIPEGTIDSELFGHEKGSFTGAVSARKGYFEEADGGTLFLDEVAELPLTTQARLLRVLESGEFLKVGSSQVQKTDVRIVAATNVDLLQAVREGKFREDLYYRLSTVVIDVPPLRDRGEDILLLAKKFASDFSEKYMTPSITVSEEAQRALLIYPWPGNVRQLKNIVDQLALFNAGETISRHQVLDLLPSPDSSEARVRHSEAGLSLPAKLDNPWPYIATLLKEIEALKSRVAALEQGRYPSNPLRNESPLFLPYASGSDSEEEEAPSLEGAEREAIIAALRMNNYDKKLTANALGISTRTLYRKLHDLNIKAEA